MENHPAHAPLLSARWPVFTAELAAALAAEGEKRLAEQVGRLRVVQTCGCGDDFCQSFHTAPKPAEAYGDGHRNSASTRHGRATSSSTWSATRSGTSKCCTDHRCAD
ncbi:hypothetical protein, partial [Micromonospora sp. SL4-19]|uniref:hypothetical protein n=1 Tax=Micromonospora sp. SL4-19 TaxID=3399129 RepID=UPI003A4DE0CC